MLNPILQTLLLILFAALVLPRMWRATVQHSHGLALILGGGILVRAVLGQILFWISWLELPFARSLQMERGFWYFGSDGWLYFVQATAAASGGIDGIVSLNANYPSVFFMQVFALFIWLFGAIPSVGLLLNIVTLLATAFLIVTWARAHGIGFRGVAVPIAVLCFMPSTILWAVQPMKEGLFTFLIVLFAFTLDLWIRSWRAESPSRRAILVIGGTVLMSATIYAISAIRWYYGLIALAAAALPLASVVFVRKRPLEIATRIIAAVVTLLLMAPMVVRGSGPYLHPSIRNALASRRCCGAFGEALRMSRHTIDANVNVGSRIAMGDALRKIEDEASAPVPLPQTATGRLVAGTAALFLPRFVGSSLGIVSMGGGRGFWWFAEVDTLIFDVIVLFALASLWSGRPRPWRDPYFWYLFFATLGIIFAVAYTIGNFGTLFRHRGMILTTLVLWPLVARRRNFSLSPRL